MFPTVFKSYEKRCRCFHSKELLRWRLLSFNSVSNRARNLKSTSRFALVPFWNYSRDYTLNCTPLDPITITMKNHQNVPNWWGTYSLNLLFKVPMKLKTMNCCHKVSSLSSAPLCLGVGARGTDNVGSSCREHEWLLRNIWGKDELHPCRCPTYGWHSRGIQKNFLWFRCEGQFVRKTRGCRRF